MSEFVLRYQLIVAAVTFALLIVLGRLLYAYVANAHRTYQQGRDRAFRQSYVRGRKWLAEFIAEAEHSIDNRDFSLRYKSHPARKSADIVRDVKREKRELTTQVKLLEYQLKSYEEYFPQLADYRELILNEDLDLAAGDNNEGALDDVDPVRKYVSRADWERLSPATRNQRALDGYISRQKTQREIGRAYERYLGYLREKAGWSVTYHGACLASRTSAATLSVRRTTALRSFRRSGGGNTRSSAKTTYSNCSARHCTSASGVPISA